MEIHENLMKNKKKSSVTMSPCHQVITLVDFLRGTRQKGTKNKVNFIHLH